MENPVALILTWPLCFVIFSIYIYINNGGVITLGELGVAIFISLPILNGITIFLWVCHMISEHNVGDIEIRLPTFSRKRKRDEDGQEYRHYVTKIIEATREGDQEKGNYWIDRLNEYWKNH